MVNREISLITELLSNNTYPGRSIIIGRSEDNKHAVICYAIMGRSENSRNRVFISDGDGIRTQAFEPKKLTDPSLVIYAPVRVMGDYTIITNGDHTDTIHEVMSLGGTFEEALRTRTYEPDSPNWTPRISGLVSITEKGAINAKMSILKASHVDGGGALRYFFEYTDFQPGEARFIHTYEADGSPIPSFNGEPRCISIKGLGSCPDCLAEKLWNAFDANNKVSLFVRFLPLDGKTEVKSTIINRHEN